MENDECVTYLCPNKAPTVSSDFSQAVGFVILVDACVWTQVAFVIGF